MHKASNDACTWQTQLKRGYSIMCTHFRLVCYLFCFSAAFYYVCFSGVYSVVRAAAFNFLHVTFSRSRCTLGTSRNVCQSSRSDSRSNLLYRHFRGKSKKYYYIYYFHEQKTSRPIMQFFEHELIIRIH